ncbi:hypothetical protein NESM_000223700 [Novymonas esmeraldas]|uniref:Uncharacterized protein n=1 Tax=Novymonas esmeraldas TaxID=1808958 RepID=A0AAW0F5N7_9TRYP
MRQSRGTAAAGVAGRGSSSGSATARAAPKTPVDRSRLEHRLTQALQNADALSASPMVHDAPASAAGVADRGATVTAHSPRTRSPASDTPPALPQSSGSDFTAAAAHGEVGAAPTDGSAAAVQQRTLRAKEKEVAHLRHTVQELSSQLHNALTTLDQRADMSAELEALRSESAVESARRHEGMQHARLEMLESRVKYRTLEEQLAATYDTDVQAKATELLEPHTKEVHAANFDLLKEKIMLAQEVTTIRREYKDLQERYTRLKRETDIDGGATREMLLRSVLQKDEIAALRQQVKTSEDNLNEAVAEYEKKHRTEAQAHAAAVQKLASERDAARRDALQLKRDLVQLRQSAGAVLAQRTELETFFHAALEEVRRGAVEERRVLLLESTPAARVTAAKETLPSHTYSSLLRLEGPERWMLTDGAGAGVAVPSSSSPAGWTVDRKGLPKRIAAAPTSSTAVAVSNSARRHAAKDTRELATADSGAVVPLLHASPPYLRSGHAASPAAASSTRGGTSSEVAVPFRLSGAASAAVDRGAPSASPPEDQRDGLDGMTTSGELPLLQSLPSVPTWRDVKRVDISELRWAEKERVIQLLFKRIRQEGRRHAAQARCATTSTGPSSERADSVTPVEELSQDAGDTGGNSLTFLTQQ